jgi:signal transduction histidine kinase
MSRRSSKAAPRRSKSVASATPTDAALRAALQDVELALGASEAELREQAVRRAADLLKSRPTGPEAERLAAGLVGLVRDPSVDVRRALVEALAHALDPALDRALWDLCQDDHAFVQRAANEAQRRRSRSRAKRHEEDAVGAALARTERLGRRFSPAVAAEVRRLARAHLAFTVPPAVHDVSLALVAIKHRLADRPDDSEWRAFCAPIERRLLSIEKIMAGLKELAAHAPLSFEPTNVKRLLDDALLDVVDRVGPSRAATVTTRVDADPALVMDAPRDELRRALVNVVQNAFEALESKAKGTVTLTAAADGDYVHLRVQDDGCGVPGEEKAEAFLPGRSSKKGRRGSTNMGYGLSTAQAIADECGGHLTLESEEGAGTTLTFVLPLRHVEDEP